MPPSPSYRQESSTGMLHPIYEAEQFSSQVASGDLGNFRSTNTPFPTADVLGLNIAALHAEELCTSIGQYIENNQRRQVLYLNVHGVNLCFQYPWLFDFFNNADLLFCDGAGLRVAATILGLDLPQRITLADWIWQFAKYAEPRNYQMFFLGGMPGVPENAVNVLRRRHPFLQIAGCHHGYFDKTLNSTENQRVVDMINRSQPDLLWIGFGMPIQEKWLQENWSQLDVKVAMTAGAMLDYVSGSLRRAPNWLTNNGMEWLGRLAIEPRRLWRRYLIGNPIFLKRLLMHKCGILDRATAR